jgi:nucleotide-binding universal stress UspA family protein
MAGASVFDRIVCGVDGSDESFDAVRRAAALGTGDVVLVSCVNARAAHRSGPLGGHLIQTQEKEALAHLEAARALIPKMPAETRLLSGQPVPSILSTVDSERASMVSVGTRGHSRVAGVVFGSVTTGLLHDGTCPVLVARRSGELDAFPTVVVVGVDGSASSMAAIAAALDLKRRLGAEVVPVAATGGGDRPPIAELKARIDGLRVDPRSPVEALTDAAATADLLIVGTRGVRGLKALGSVSERVAHKAPCSVMTVLQTPWQAARELTVG